MWDERFEGILRPYLPFLSPDEPLAADAGLRELGLDSLAMVELLAALESAYDVKFTDDALTLETFETPGVLWGTLSGVLARSA
ncbi:phosphopantetheine-binding protein [Allonocardiopsis opalescens]|uniref:Acyl carrier protein n=1 Tax=Allonocardiopsis opalescens TaxID=1144618 RepID=A0A2T0QD22_9ACTN|nr:phosphopantetheine-binding protein [Allonocardiopsis opalescens]PRY01753.1 acyl carrier protein [Allonocardiopsis opalescens]